ncbi:MAG: hypothetical protein Q8J68_14600 [Methanolobus sp.]|uniref:hypothetical protein n=1 Tax=Methanolobus sp. TaxID=1874737 RepID=UPI00273159A4|nr:hypothetical protein [Methanolobus sp.]MDP2218504.1 hypothetical protein [Methanolobus sp.]
MNEKSQDGISRPLDKFVKRAIKYLGCNTARILAPCNQLFLIIGFNRNTKTDDKPGQWVKNGKPIDFDYIEEHVIASGKDSKELWESVKSYRKMQRETYNGKKPGLPFLSI